MSPSTCVHHLKLFIEPSHCCLRADGSWSPAPGKHASIWVSTQSFQPGRKWEQAQLSNLSRAYLDTKHTPGEAPKHSVCVICSVLQGNVCPQQNSLAQNREKRMPKSQEWHWSKGVCSLGGLELFLPVPLETISLREHIILLDLPNIGLFCVTEEFLFPGQNS